MQVITFVNLKGGTSKTTSALAVGACLAQTGRPVLLVDLDPQGTLTVSAGASPGPSVAEVLSGSVRPDTIQRTIVPGLDLVAGNRRTDFVGTRSPVQLGARLNEFFGSLGEQYEVVIIDPPPQPSFLVAAAMSVSDAVYVPVASGRGALDGLNDVYELATRAGTSPVAGVFVTRVNVSSIHDREMAAWVVDNYPVAFETYVRETVRVREAEMARQPVPVYDAEATASKDYAALSEEITERLHLTLPTHV